MKSPYFTESAPYFTCHYPMLGFQSFRTAARTLHGIEAMHMIKKGQVKSLGTSVSEKVNFIHKLFELAA